MVRWEIEAVDQWVEETAKAPVTAFYPTATAKDTGLPLEQVFERLQQLALDEKLILIWQLKCPYCFNIVQEISGCEPFRKQNCDCGTEVEPDTELIFPIFIVNSKYKDFVKKKQKSQVQKLLGSYGRKVQRSKLLCHN